MRSFFTIAAMLTMVYGLSCCSASQVDCPPANQTFIVHKNPEKEFPVYVAETRSEINITLDALEQLRLGPLQSATLQELTRLQNTLTNISASFDTTAKPAFLSYHQNPCEANTDYFKIMSEINQIRELGNVFNRIIDNEAYSEEDKIMEAVNNYRKTSETEGIQSL